MDYILGLDLGVASLGWAVLWCDETVEPTGFAEWVDENGEVRPALGSRIFDAGVESGKLTLEKAMEKGEDVSNAKGRRVARGMRRQHLHHSQRRGQQFRALVSMSLLPKPPVDSRKARHELLLELDRKLKDKWCEKGNLLDQQTWIYRLRAAAVEGPLEAFEVGRALYQLGHRRGFRSNRKTDQQSVEEKDNGDEKKRPKRKKAEAEQSIKTESPKTSNTEGDDEAKKLQGMLLQIKNLGDELKKSGETLGAHMATLNPMERRIRGQFTGRQMYLDEFKAIIDKQGEYHPCLRDQATINAIYKAIFGQRGLKSSRRMIGRCPLEPGKVRAIKALPIAQEFRMLQKLNDLEIIAPGETSGVPLSEEQRQKALQAMESHANISFNGLRIAIDLGPGHRWEKGEWNDAGTWVPHKKGKEARLVEKGWTFNFEPQTEDGGKEELPGNRTMAKLRPIFPHWAAMSQETRDEIIFMLDSAERPEVIEKVATKKREAWGLDDTGIRELRKVHLESGRAAFSRLALEKMTEKMKEKIAVEGVTRYRRYQEARRAAYPKIDQVPVEDYLPPVLLSARHPKRWEETGERIMDPRIAVRNPAVLRVLTEMRKVVNGIVRKFGSKPRLIRIESGKELAKGRMEREKQWHDNLRRRKEIDGIVQAAGGDPKNPFDREKILLADECEWTCPYSGDQITPHKLYALDQFAVEHIIPLSRSLDNSMRNKTLCGHDWNQRKNNRTPWEAFHGTAEWDKMVLRVRDHFHGRSAKLKAKLFQMRPEEVQAEYKDKFTERHLRDMQFASKAARKYLSLLYGDRSEDGYSSKIQAVSGGMTAHLRRAWGLECVIPTLKDLPKAPDGTKDGEKFRFDHRHHALDAAVVAMTTPKEIQRLANQVRLDEMRRAFNSPARFPRNMRAPLANCAAALRERLDVVVVSHREDRKVAGKFHKALPVRMVRGQPSCRGAKPMGRQVKGVDERFVELNSNHHTAIFEEIGKGAIPRWKDLVATRFNVYRRLSRNHLLEKEGKPKLPLVDWPVGVKPVMVLQIGDALLLDDDPSSLWTVQSISTGDIWLRPHNDARRTEVVKDKNSPDSKAFRFRAVDKLRQRNAKKVTITPLGEIVYVGYRAHP